MGCISCLFAWISLVFSSPGQMSQGGEWRKKPSLPQSWSHLKVITIIRSKVASKQLWELPDTHYIERRGLHLLSLGDLGSTNSTSPSSWTFVNIHCGLYNWRIHTFLHCTVGTVSISVRSLNFNLQAIGEFRGKHLPRYRLFFMGCSLGPRMWPD